MVRSWRGLSLWLCVLSASCLMLGGCGPGVHKVSITSDPPGALIFLNNKILGETPLETPMEQRAGDYNIYIFKAVKDDYLPMKMSFKELLYYDTVYDVVPERIHFPLIQRARYHIFITSEPVGAVVALNGEVIGETPFTATIKERIGSPRVFDFIAIKEGYQEAHQVLHEFVPQDNGAVFEFPETMHFELQKVGVQSPPKEQ